MRTPVPIMIYSLVDGAGLFRLDPYKRPLNALRPVIASESRLDEHQPVTYLTSGWRDVCTYVRQ